MHRDDDQVGLVGVVPFGGHRGQDSPPDREGVGLRAAAGENHLLWAGTDQRGDLLAGQVQRGPGGGAERVLARRVTERLPQCGQQGLQDSGVNGVVAL